MNEKDVIDSPNEPQKPPTSPPHDGWHYAHNIYIVISLLAVIKSAFSPWLQQHSADLSFIELAMNGGWAIGIITLIISVRMGLHLKKAVRSRYESNRKKLQQDLLDLEKTNHQKGKPKK